MAARQAAHSTKTPPGKGVVVSAWVLQGPDLAFCTTVQNLLAYSVELLTSFQEGRGEAETLTQFLFCIDALEKKSSGAVVLPPKVRELITQFLEGGRKVFELINAERDNTSGQSWSSSQSIAAILAAKTFTMQWLSICIGDELRAQLLGASR